MGAAAAAAARPQTIRAERSGPVAVPSVLVVELVMVLMGVSLGRGRTHVVGR